MGSQRWKIMKAEFANEEQYQVVPKPASTKKLVEVSDAEFAAV
jgi:hypothetical protein